MQTPICYWITVFIFLTFLHNTQLFSHLLPDQTFSILLSYISLQTFSVLLSYMSLISHQ